MRKSKNINGRRIGKAIRSWKNNKDYFNCWGCTLFILDSVDYLDWASRSDIEDFITDETLPVYNHEKIQAGDILVLYDKDSVIHTAVYLSDKKLFHKVGDEQAEFADEERVKDIYCEHTEFERVRLAG